MPNTFQKLGGSTGHFLNKLVVLPTHFQSNIAGTLDFVAKTVLKKSAQVEKSLSQKNPDLPNMKK